MRAQSKNKLMTRCLCLLNWLALAGLADAGKIRYAHDDAGRLVGADYGAGRVATYVYDANGNLLAQTTAFVTNADLRLTKTASVAVAAEGETFTYTLTVSNAGPEAATDVIVTDPLPFGILFSGAAASQGTMSLSNRTVIANVGLLPATASASITVSVIHGVAIGVTNIASALAAQADPVPANNAAAQATTGLPAVDSDGDAMPDWWEELHGLDPLGDAGANGADEDNDGDGPTNFEEFLADTDPNDAGDVLAIEQVTGTTSINVSYQSSPLRRYALQINAVLTNTAGWTGLPPPRDGDGAQQTLTDSASATNRFYRLEAERP